MGNFGERLREERERLGLNQADFGEAGGVRKQAQLKYEKSERSPDAAYLAAIADAGADIQYIVTGTRSDAALTPDERELIALFRAAPLAVKAAAIGALHGGSAPAQTQATFNGPVVGGIAGRDITTGKSRVGARKGKGG